MPSASEYICLVYVFGIKERGGGGLWLITDDYPSTAGDFWKCFWLIPNERSWCWRWHLFAGYHERLSNALFDYCPPVDPSCGLHWSGPFEFFPVRRWRSSKRGCRRSGTPEPSSTPSPPGDTCKAKPQKESESVHDHRVNRYHRPIPAGCRLLFFYRSKTLELAVEWRVCSAVPPPSVGDVKQWRALVLCAFSRPAVPPSFFFSFLFTLSTYTLAAEEGGGGSRCCDQSQRWGRKSSTTVLFVFSLSFFSLFYWSNSKPGLWKHAGGSLGHSFAASDIEAGRCGEEQAPVFVGEKPTKRRKER